MSVPVTTFDPALVPGDDRSLQRFGYGIIAVVFAGFGGWATLAPIDSAAVAHGVVTVQSYRRTVQHLEGGIVRALYVREGDLVVEGQPLLDLEGTQFRAELDVLLVQQLALQAQESRLLAERDGRETVAFPVPTDLAATDARVRDAFASQETLFQARRKAYLGEVSVLNQSINQLESQTTGLEAVVRSKGALLGSYAQEMKDLRELLAEGFADRQHLREFERNSQLLEGEVADVQASIAATHAKISEVQLRVLQVDRAFQSDVAKELSEVQAKLSDVTERVNGARDRVDRAVLRAPVSGRVLQLAAHTVGGVVSPGQPVMHIVPQKEALVVEAKLSPNDIDRVQAGLPARLRFTGFGRDIAPTVQGHVTTVSADSIVDDKTQQSYYLARVEIDAAELQKLSKLELKPGMPAEALINTGSRSFLTYLLSPLSNSVARSFRED